MAFALDMMVAPMGPNLRENTKENGLQQHWKVNLLYEPNKLLTPWSAGGGGALQGLIFCFKCLDGGFKLSVMMPGTEVYFCQDN